MAWYDNIDQLRGAGSGINRYQQTMLDYYDRIQQYKGTRYYDLLLNNPYVGNKFSGSTIGNLLTGEDQTDSIWANGNAFSTILNALSFGLSGAIGENLNKSAADQYYQQQEQAMNEEFDRILSMKEQDEYNSPAQQMARQRAAGVNTSLAGTENVSASSGAGPDETSSPMSAAEISQAQNGQLAQIGQVAMGFVEGCMNMYSFFQDASGKSIANAAGDIALADNVYNYAVKTAAGLSSLPGTRAEYDALSEAEKLGADETLYDTLQAAIKTGDLGSMQLNRRARNLLKKMTGRVMYDKNGKPTLAFQAQRATMLKQFYGDTQEAGKAAGHPTMSTPEDFATVIEKAMTFFGDYEQKVRDTQFALQDIYLRQETASAESAEAQSAYDRGMYSEALGTAEGEARKAEAKARKVIAELDSYLDSQLDTLLNELDQYGIGGKIAKIGLVSLRSALKSFSMSLSPFGKAGGLKPSFGIQ